MDEAHYNVEITPEIAVNGLKGALVLTSAMTGGMDAYLAESNRVIAITLSDVPLTDEARGTMALRLSSLLLGLTLTAHNALAEVKHADPNFDQLRRRSMRPRSGTRKRQIADDLDALRERLIGTNRGQVLGCNTRA